MSPSSLFFYFRSKRCLIEPKNFEGKETADKTYGDLTLICLLITSDIATCCERYSPLRNPNCIEIPVHAESASEEVVRRMHVH